MDTVESLTTAYEQLEQQHEWAMVRQMFTLADAYKTAMGTVASKLIDMTVEDFNHAN